MCWKAVEEASDALASTSFSVLALERSGVQWRDDVGREHGPRYEAGDGTCCAGDRWRQGKNGVVSETSCTRPCIHEG